MSLNDKHGVKNLLAKEQRFVVKYIITQKIVVNNKKITCQAHNFKNILLIRLF